MSNYSTGKHSEQNPTLLSISSLSPIYFFSETLGQNIPLVNTGVNFGGHHPHKYTQQEKRYATQNISWIHTHIKSAYVQEESLQKSQNSC